MITVAKNISLLNSLAFVVLNILVFVSWRRRRDRSQSAVLVAVTSLGIVSLIGMISKLTGYRSRILSDASIVSFLGSGYAFLLLRHAFIPLSRKVRLGALSMLIGATFLALAARFPLDSSAVVRYSTLQFLAIVTFVLTWSACVVEPAFRFWSAAKGRPLVPRARMRAMSAAYGAVVVLLFVGVASGPQERHPLTTLVLALFGVPIAPLLYVAFAPPRWVRRAWREPEEEILRRSTENMMRFNTSRSDLANEALEDSLRLLGADAGLVLDADGSVLAEIGSHGVDARVLGSLALDEDGRSVLLDGSLPAYALVVPLRLFSGMGRIVVVSGPFTPIFDDDEIHRLDRFAVRVALALDRVLLTHGLAAQTQRYETLLQAMSDVGQGFIVAERARAVYVNDAYTRMTGYTLEDLQTFDSLLDLAWPEVRPAIFARDELRRDGEVVPDLFETAMIHKEGRRIDLEVAVQMLNIDGKVQAASLVRDITDRKEAERELLKIDGLRSDFISNAAHELRTPLTVVTGLASTLSSKRSTLTTSQFDEGFGALGRQVERIRVLIDNLLDLSRLEQSNEKVHLQPVDVRGATERALEGAPPPSGLALDVSMNGHAVLGDPARIDQVLINFFTNAYRYGGNQMHVVADDVGDSVVISVVDDGPGVPDDLVSSLFDPFTRGVSVRRVQGSGLGLAIVKRLVESLGGEVWYEPVSPHGAKFAVRLPKAAA